MSEPLVVVDADVLGRHRTGDETYVRNLLRELGTLASGLRIAAVTRHPELVPDGIEPLALRTPVQETRMLWTLPRLLRRRGAALVHTQYAVPFRSPCPAVVTIHDLSFEHDPSHMPLKDRLVFRRVVPQAARVARRVLTVSERTRADLVRLYGLPEAKVVVTPNGVDPAFTPGNPLTLGTYVLVVGAVQARKNQIAALAAAEAVPLPLVVAGPVKDEALASRLREGGADLRGYVSQEELVELYRGAACLVQPSRFEGFGLPVLEAMACGTPVVALDEPALREVAGDAAVFVDERHLAGGVQRAIEERDRLVAAGLERARGFSWRVSAERTLDAYREALG
ncbi:MAG TPA: glycosyltransferase family 1 protein [Gaiellaceae bacterium]|nr:glycosyltransferase family 1 protein [Gaiellaceae bacterium]